MSIRELQILIAVLLFSALPCVGSRQEHSPNSSETTSSNPYSMGERLVYTVKWDPPWYLFFLPSMEAGEIELHLAGEAIHRGRNTWQINFKARSSGSLSRMAGVKVEDDFSFITERDTLCTLSVSRRIREGKRKRQIDVEYFGDMRQLHIREVDEAVVPPKLKKDEIKKEIPPCVHDPFSAIYSLRRLMLRPKLEQTFMVGHDDRVKEVISRVEKKEIIETPMGVFPAWSIHTAALMGGLFKEGGQFRIWLSADERKIPVQFEARLHLGKAVGKLKSVAN